MTLNPREKVIALCVGAAVGLYALDQLLLSPYFDRLSKADDAVAVHQSDIHNANAVLQSEISSQKHWKQISADRITADASNAESQLLNRVQAVARDSSLTLSSLKTEKSEKEKGYDRVTLRATANGTMLQIARFLYALQTADIPVKVSDLQLTARKDGFDDLTMNFGLATIYHGATPAKVAQGYSRTETFQ